MAAPLYTTASGLLFHAGKILVVTVGLPARGKTHISRSLERYLRWLGVKTTVVSLGDYRRKTVGGAQQLPKDYFNLGERSAETNRLRQSVAEGCEQQIWRFFEGGGQVVIYDANNGTRAARQRLAEIFDKAGIHVVFLESICDNKEIVEANIRSVKISSPDYKGWDQEKAIHDYYRRISDHEKYYESIDDKDWPSIRIFNVGDKIEVNKISGYLQSRIIFFLMNIHNKFRMIYFARSGQSLIEHSYRADSDLSPAGWEYADKLKDFVLERRAKALEARGLNPAERRLVIWTSARRRAHHTAWPFLTHAGTAGVASGSPSTAPSGSATPIPSAHNPPSLLVQAQIAAALNAAANNANLPAGARQTPRQGGSSPGQQYLHLPTAMQQVSPSQSPVLQPQGATNPPLRVKVVEKPQMSEINPGVWDGLSPEQAQKLYPDEWERFLRDPYAFRAPRAESYHDLCVRLEPVLVELERCQEDLLIIGHASVIRCLLSYLIGLPASEIPAIEVARGDLLEVLPASYGVYSQAYHFWDGPGRRGSVGSQSGGVSDGVGLGLTVQGGSGSRRAASVARMEGETAVSDDGDDDENDLEGAGGGAGVFGSPILGVGEGQTEEDESKNFYENYAEDTTGKRKADITAD